MKKTFHTTAYVPHFKTPSTLYREELEGNKPQIVVKTLPKRPRKDKSVVKKPRVIIKPYGKKTPVYEHGKLENSVKITKKPIVITPSIPTIVKNKPMEVPKVVKKQKKSAKISKSVKNGNYLPFNKPWPDNKQHNFNLRKPKPLSKPVLLNIPG